MTLIFFASTDLFSASHTGNVLRTIVTFVFPHIRERSFNRLHFFVRKAGHFSEYALLALFAGRAFRKASSQNIARYWFLCAFFLVAVYSLTDEYHQRFVPTRTSSIYDSMIDTAGGATMLVIVFLVGKLRSRKRVPEDAGDPV